MTSGLPRYDSWEEDFITVPQFKVERTRSRSRGRTVGEVDHPPITYRTGNGFLAPPTTGGSGGLHRAASVGSRPVTHVVHINNGNTGNRSKSRGRSSSVSSESSFGYRDRSRSKSCRGRSRSRSRSTSKSSRLSPEVEWRLQELRRREEEEAVTRKVRDREVYARDEREAQDDRIMRQVYERECADRESREALERYGKGVLDNYELERARRELKDRERERMEQEQEMKEKAKEKERDKQRKYDYETEMKLKKLREIEQKEEETALKRKMEQEQRAREALAKLQREEMEREEEEMKKKTIEEWQHEQAFKSEQARKKKEKEDREFRERVVAEFTAAGYSQESIEEILKRTKHKERLTLEAPSKNTAVAAPRDNDNWIKVKTKYILPETLERYDLPWMYDEGDSDYLIIKKNISRETLDALYSHTSKLKKKTLLIKEKGEKKVKDDREYDRMFLVRRKKDRGKSPMATWFLT